MQIDEIIQVQPPPLADEAAWHKIIFANAIASFTPEQVLTVYDTCPMSCSKVIQHHVAKYILDRIEGRLFGRFGPKDRQDFFGECRGAASEIILEALVNRDHARFEGLRTHFDETISFIFLDAVRNVAKNRKRNSRVVSSSQSEEVTQNISSDETFQERESELIRQMDATESMARLNAAFRTVENLKTVFDLTLEKKSQLEIAEQIGLSDRQVRRIQNKIIAILSEPDVE